MSDSDPINQGKIPDTLTRIIVDAVASAHWKLYAFIFVLFIFISSDVFIGSTLGHIAGATENGTPTNYGVFIQGLFLVLFVIIIDIAISQKIV
jgi:hypothetical protein